MARFGLDRIRSTRAAGGSTRAAVIFLFLFGVPFAAGGTFVGYLAGSTVHDWARSRSWHEVPAQIVSTDLDVNRGDDSDTYRVRAEYRYEYGGRTYTSHRVAHGFGSDNIGSFHRDKHAELRAYVQSGRPFRCFVNHDNPAEAVLYRELRWGLLGFQVVFSAAFSLVGYGLMFAAVFGGRKVKESERLKATRPDEPWAWEEDWVDGVVTAGSRGKMIGALLFATLWNLISAPMIIVVPREVAAGNHLALIGAIFPLVGAVLAAYAAYAVLQWRKFGNSEFEMHAVPGVLGGYLEGRIHTNMRRPGTPFRLRLNCIRKETRGSGKNRSTTERTLWQDEVEVPGNALLAGRHGASVPVRFAIPYDAGPQSDPDASDPVEWRLEVAAELPGIDYSTHFSVPVFETPDSDPALSLDVHETAIADEPRPPVDLAAMGIVRRPTPAGGVQYLFRRARAKGAAFGLTTFTAIWCGFIWLLLAVDAPLLFPIVFGLFALLMLFGIVDLWLGQTRVEVGRGRLAFNRRFLGPGRTRVFHAGEVTRIKVKRGMQSGNRLFYQIELRTRGGKKHTLAGQIRDQRLARRIARDLQTTLTFDPAPVDPVIDPLPGGAAA